jgi:hypothetical protein
MIAYASSRLSPLTSEKRLRGTTKLLQASAPARETVNAKFDQIAAHPDQFATAGGDFRFAKVGRFPYVILFRGFGDVVQITGVFHTASDRAKWRKRMTDA